MDIEEEGYVMWFEGKGYYAKHQPHYEWSFTDNIHAAQLYKTLKTADDYLVRGCKKYETTGQVMSAVKVRHIEDGQMISEYPRAKKMSKENLLDLWGEFEEFKSGTEKLASVKAYIEAYMKKHNIRDEDFAVIMDTLIDDGHIIKHTRSYGDWYTFADKE